MVMSQLKRVPGLKPELFASAEEPNALSPGELLSSPLVFFRKGLISQVGDLELLTILPPSPHRCWDVYWCQGRPPGPEVCQQAFYQLSISRLEKKKNECFTGSSYQNQATVSLYLWRVGPVVPLSVASHSVVSVIHGQWERARTYLHVHSMLSWEGEGSHVHNFTVCLFRFGSLQCWRGCPGPCVWAARAYHWATPPSTQLLLYYIVTVLVTVNLLVCLIYELNLYHRHVWTGGNSTQRIRHLSCLTHPGQP